MRGPCSHLASRTAGVCDACFEPLTKPALLAALRKQEKIAAELADALHARPSLSAALDALEAWVTWERETLAALAGVRLREPLPPSPTETTRALLVTAGRKP